MGSLGESIDAESAIRTNFFSWTHSVDWTKTGDSFLVSPGSAGFEEPEYHAPGHTTDNSIPRTVYRNDIVKYEESYAKGNTGRDQMLGLLGRATFMNTLAASHPQFPMCKPVYGFRPESGWPGVIFQVFMQGPFIAAWQKEKELEYWITFGSQSMKAVFFEVEAEVALPDIEYKRNVLQCVVPPKDPRDGGSFPVNLKVIGTGGKTVAQDLFIGLFRYKTSGIIPPNTLIQTEV
jgi:hypothetical protein